MLWLGGHMNRDAGLIGNGERKKRSAGRSPGQMDSPVENIAREFRRAAGKRLTDGRRGLPDKAQPQPAELGRGQ